MAECILTTGVCARAFMCVCVDKGEPRWEETAEKGRLISGVERRAILLGSRVKQPGPLSVAVGTEMSTGEQIWCCFTGYSSEHTRKQSLISVRAPLNTLTLLWKRILQDARWIHSVSFSRLCEGQDPSRQPVEACSAAPHCFIIYICFATSYAVPQAGFQQISDADNWVSWGSKSEIDVLVCHQIHFITSYLFSWHVLWGNTLWKQKINPTIINFFSSNCLCDF